MAMTWLPGGTSIGQRRDALRAPVDGDSRAGRDDHLQPRGPLAQRQIERDQAALHRDHVALLVEIAGRRHAHAVPAGLHLFDDRQLGRLGAVHPDLGALGLRRDHQARLRHLGRRRGRRPGRARLGVELGQHRLELRERLRRVGAASALVDLLEVLPIVGDGAAEVVGPAVDRVLASLRPAPSRTGSRGAARASTRFLERLHRGRELARAERLRAGVEVRLRLLEILRGLRVRRGDDERQRGDEATHERSTDYGSTAFPGGA